MQGSRRSLAVALLFALSLVGSGIVGPAVAQTQAAEPKGADDFAQQSPPANATETNDSATNTETNDSTTNNSTVRHVNPDNVSNEETLTELRGALSDRMAARLNESSIKISEGEYASARGELDEEFLESLEKYEEVEVELSDDANVTAGDFERARNSTVNFSLAAQDFNQTYEAYQDAKRRGDEEKARQLAHRLNNISTQAERSADRLNETYANLSEETKQNFSDQREQIAAVKENISATGNQVVMTELRATTLRLTANDSNASFVDPMGISGQLIAANGSSVANQTVTIAVGNRRYETKTDEKGQFALEYRPTTLSVNASNVSVRYVPTETSLYTASNGTLPIDVKQVNATVTIDNQTDRVAYNEQVSARGTLSVDGRAVPGYPLSLTLGNQSLATNRTTANGSFAANESISASVPTGERPLRVEGPQNGSAVAVSTQSESIVVEPTPTNTTLSVRANESDLIATGRLTVEGGQGLEGRSVRVSVGGEAIERVETDADGRYELRVEAENLSGSTVKATFEGSESNLESSNATAPLPEELRGLEAINSPNGFVELLLSWVFRGPLPPSLVFGIVAVVLAAGGYVLHRIRSSDDETSDDDESEEEPEDVPEVLSPTAVFSTDELLEQGEFERAIRLAYRSVQNAVSPMLDGSHRRQTHRQFYRACQRSGIAAGDELDTLVETYEMAVYGGQTEDVGRVHEAVEAAQRLVRQFQTDSSDDSE